MKEIIFRNKTRDSNIELLRLACMIMILVHHMITRGIFSVDTILCHIGGVNFTMAYSIILNDFCYIGVNCFILISGYYSIKFKTKSLFNLYLTCAFYFFLMQIVEIYLLNLRSLSFATVKETIFVFSHQEYWWFIQCYVILYLLSPLLNRSLNTLSKTEYKGVLFLLTIVNLYLGYWWERYADNGYSVAQFVYIYAIGHYLYRFVDKDVIDSHRWMWLMAYIGTMLVFCILSIGSHYIAIPHWNSLPYNNPLLVIGALSFFIFMLSFHFQSNIINRLAASALAIYLLQNFEVMHNLANLFSKTVGTDFTIDGGTEMIVILSLFLFGFAVLFSLLSIMIDQIRLLLVSPIASFVGNFSFCKRIDSVFSPSK